MSVMKNNAILTEKFCKCVKGYHMINYAPIKESVWEVINESVFKHAGIEVYSSSNGSHSPGMDIDSKIGKLSNKTSKYSKKGDFVISSYRLTSVCNQKNVGDPSVIAREINLRKNFHYYSVLVRDEHVDPSKPLASIKYDWLCIPAECPYFNPSFYEWKPCFNKKGVQTGWVTDVKDDCYMNISFSMSSQLWIHLSNEKMKEYNVSSVTVENKQTSSYLDIYELDNASSVSELTS